MTYDADGRLISFTSGGVPTSYYYDGEGHRVMTQNPAATTVFVYGAAGNLAAEYSQQPQQSLCAICYLTKDHLGSTRMVTDQKGCAVYRTDYLPFGELILTSSTSPRFNAVEHVRLCSELNLFDPNGLYTVDCPDGDSADARRRQRGLKMHATCTDPTVGVMALYNLTQ